MKKVLLDDICKQIATAFDELPINVSGKRNIQTGQYDITMELNLIDKYEYKTLKTYEDKYLKISKIVHK